MMRGTRSVVAAALVGSAIGLWISPGRAYSTEDQEMRPARWMTVPCELEDGTSAGAPDKRIGCYWDAQERGNGRGHSFYVVELPGRGDLVCTFYTETRYARHHDTCERDR